MLARCHYTQAMVDGTIYNLNGDAYVQVLSLSLSLSLSVWTYMGDFVCIRIDKT